MQWCVSVVSSTTRRLTHSPCQHSTQSSFCRSDPYTPCLPITALKMHLTGSCYSATRTWWDTSPRGGHGCTVQFCALLKLLFPHFQRPDLLKFWGGVVDTNVPLLELCLEVNKATPNVTDATLMPEVNGVTSDAAHAMPPPQLRLEVNKPISNAMLQSEVSEATSNVMPLTELCSDVNEATSGITNDELDNTLHAACPLGLSYVLALLWG